MTFRDAIYYLQQVNQGREVQPDDPARVLYSKGVVDGRNSRVNTELLVSDPLKGSPDYVKGFFHGISIEKV